MRAGAFSDKRVIELLNRRFVPYYFNRSGKGRGGNTAASAFTTGKTKNPYAYFAAFAPDGAYLGETEIYADKDETYAWLQGLLARYPEYNGAPAAESEQIEKGGLDAARLLEERGEFDRALALYAGIDHLDARLAEIRVARYRADWKALEAGLAKLDAKEHADHVATERAYHLLAEKRYAEAQALLRAALKEHADSVRRAEMHFSAGVASWFLGQRDWAKFHWMWVVENLPDDRLYMRCRIAAAAEGMPYPNPELGGYKSRGMIGPQHIVAEIARSRRVYQQLKPQWERGEFEGAEREPPGDPAKLVPELKDGNEHRARNEEVVDQLAEIGAASLKPLLAALEDPAFQGRGYAAWALARVMGVTGEQPKKAVQLLRDLASDDDPYVRALAASGRKQLEGGGFGR